MTQILPYPAVTSLPDINVDDVIVNDKKKETSTPKIIMEPDKRMYYYLPE